MDTSVGPFSWHQKRDPSFFNMRTKLESDNGLRNLLERFTSANVELQLEKARWEVRLARLLEDRAADSNGRRDHFPWSGEELNILAQMKTPGGAFGRGTSHLDLLENHMADLLKRPLSEIQWASSRHRYIVEEQSKLYMTWWADVRRELEIVKIYMTDRQLWRTFAREVAREEARHGVLEQTPWERRGQLWDGKGNYMPENSENSVDTKKE